MHTDSSGHSHDHSHNHDHDHDHPHDHSHGGHEHSRGHEQQAHALEQQLNEMVQQGRVLEAYMNDIMNRQAAVGKMLEEARVASATIQGISADSDSETLMPVGIGVYVKTSVPAAKKLLVSLGNSGVTLEKSRDDALNYVEARIKEYEVAMRQLEGQRQQIAMQMEQVQEQVNMMLRAAQSRQG
ncbi:MAG TPA: prefoldin subunit alpha [Nitrososphaera sp.]|nr:prefoldin subunit alpha [Nitrososphaera sp.]